jgi:hypothetical protein
MAKQRTINEIRQVKDTVYKHPELNEVEQNLLNDLNYKAKLILDIESIFKTKNVPCNSVRLYDLDEKQLESLLMVWKDN